MLINKFLYILQCCFSKIYERSYILKNIDYIIFLSIILVLVSSTFMASDSIGYFALFGIILTCIKLITKPNVSLSLSVAEKFLLLYFLIVLISVAGSSYLYLSLKGFSKTLIYLGFYLTCIEYFKNNRKNIKYVFLIFALLAFGQSLIALKQNFLSVGEISGWQDVSHINPEDVMTRVYGSIKPYNPNLFGGYMLSVIPSVLILFLLPFVNKHYKLSVFGFMCFVLVSISLILTGCRGAYIGLFCELLLIFLFSYRFLKPTFKRIYNMIVAVISFLITIVIFSVSSVKTRVISIFAMRNDSSNSFRFNVYHSCINMFKDNWLLGIGVGNQNFREIYGLYMKTGFDALSAYNIYLETALESGIFALIAFLCFIIINVKRALFYIYNKRRFSVIYVVIALVSITGLLIHGMVDTVFFRPQLQFVFWTMIAIIRVITTASFRGVYVRRRN